MEQKSESVLEAIYEEETLQYDHLLDVEMIDAETLDRDFSQHHLVNESAKAGEYRRRNSRRRKSKKKNKKSGAAASNITDANRFLVDTCRHLKERKSYLVLNAVGVLGASTVSNLVKAVDAIQDCGGQLTADGKRFCSGGGILSHPAREPKAYKEIMAKGKEFETQFRQQNNNK
ncbi:hypothetical protein MRB53_012770 [Persea americana]|uniref:Uncharacterized protein n=1 Tax=Persea americana TaxID=3435 RepID=A0ACC2LZ74_PERAE|nr:hypothetical protein MRB53_012770 [Persea americana]